MNGSDCGVFTCKYAEYITKDKPITFTQVGLLSEARVEAQLKNALSLFDPL